MYQSRSFQQQPNAYPNRNKQVIYKTQTSQNRAPPPPVERIEYEDEEEVSKLFNRTSILLNLIKMILIGLGLVLFTVGMLYLTIYRYQYSFTVFSIDMMAGLFIAVGSLMSTGAIISLFKIKPDRNQALVGFYAFVSFLTFVLLFILGVVGLSLNSNGEFQSQIRSNMLSTARRFDDRNPHSHANRKVEWMHRQFECCGVDGYADWKSLLRFFTNVQIENNQRPIIYEEQQQNIQKYPYMDDVPDSCCLRPSFNCGKSNYVFGKDRSEIIYTKGCLNIYTERFSKDLIFVCSLSITIACIVFVMSIMLLIAFAMIKKNRSYLHRFARNYLYEQEEKNSDYLLRN